MRERKRDNRRRKCRERAKEEGRGRKDIIFSRRESDGKEQRGRGQKKREGESEEEEER